MARKNSKLKQAYANVVELHCQPQSAVIARGIKRSATSLSERRDSVPRINGDHYRGATETRFNRGAHAVICGGDGSSQSRDASSDSELTSLRFRRVATANRDGVEAELRRLIDQERLLGIKAARAVLARALKCSAHRLPGVALQAVGIYPRLSDDVARSALGFWMMAESGQPTNMPDRLALLAHGRGLFEAALAQVNDRRVRSDVARAGAFAMLAKHPKQQAKAQAYELWRAWRSGSASYKTKADFAEAVLEALPVLTNDKVVTGWVRKWDRESAAEGGSKGK